jgi:hypothetical protein
MVDWRCRRRYLTVYLAEQMGDGGGKDATIKNKVVQARRNLKQRLFLLREQRETDIRSKIEARADPSQAHAHAHGHGLTATLFDMIYVVIMLH